MRLAHSLLHPSGRRVELYVRASRTRTHWTLVALAGEPTADGALQPAPPEMQGPYRSCEDALGALHRIVAMLVERDFADAGGQLQWELIAARAARDGRGSDRINEESPGDTAPPPDREPR